MKEMLQERIDYLLPRIHNRGVFETYCLNLRLMRDLFGL